MEAIEEIIKVEFLNEARELVEDIEQSLSKLVNTPSSKEIIDKLFRNAHTFKGSALCAGLDDLSKIGHAFEELVYCVRSDKIQLTSEINRTLSEANLTCKESITRLSANLEHQIHYKDIVQKLNQLLPIDYQSMNQTFSNIPLDKSANDIYLKGNSKTKAQTLSESKVLVAEDDPEVLEVIVDSLGRQKNYRVKGFSNPLEIDLEWFKPNSEESYDLVITDIKMPGLSGVELASKIKKVNSETPIIVLSGFGGKEQLMSLIDIGVEKFLDKPFSDEELLNAVSKALKAKVVMDGLLKMAKTNFHVHVTLSKVLGYFENENIPETLNLDLQRLRELNGEIQELTHNLLVD